MAEPDFKLKKEIKLLLYFLYMSVREKEEVKGEYISLIVLVGSSKIKKKESPQYLETMGDFKNHYQNK